MRNDLPPELQELLTFAWEVGFYFQTQSTWRTGVLTSSSQTFNQGFTSKTLSFSGNVIAADLPVPITCELYSQWDLLPPKIICAAPWIRKHRDWHVISDAGQLCWVYPPYWREILRGLTAKSELRTLRATAAYWFIEQSVDLICKHLEADRLSLKTWPKAWPAWAHGDILAGRQLEEMKRTGYLDAEIARLLNARHRYQTTDIVINPS